MHWNDNTKTNQKTIVKKYNWKFIGFYQSSTNFIAIFVLIIQWTNRNCLNCNDKAIEWLARMRDKENIAIVQNPTPNVGNIYCYFIVLDWITLQVNENQRISIEQEQRRSRKYSKSHLHFAFFSFLFDLIYLNSIIHDDHWHVNDTNHAVNVFHRHRMDESMQWLNWSNCIFSIIKITFFHHFFSLSLLSASV